MQSTRGNRENRGWGKSPLPPFPSVNDLSPLSRHMSHWQNWHAKTQSRQDCSTPSHRSLRLCDFACAVACPGVVGSAVISGDRFSRTCAETAHATTATERRGYSYCALTSPTISHRFWTFTFKATPLVNLSPPMPAAETCFTPAETLIE